MGHSQTGMTAPDWYLDMFKEEQGELRKSVMVISESYGQLQPQRFLRASGEARGPEQRRRVPGTA